MAAPPEDTAAPATPTRPPRGLVRETLAVFAATFVATAAVGLLGRFVPFVADNVLAFVAAIFLYGPLWVLGRRDEDLRSFGLTSAGWPRHLLAALLMLLVVFPPFVGGYHLYQNSYNPEDHSYTILSVTSDSGLWVVYAGFFLLCAGVFWRLWLRPVAAYLAKGRREWRLR